MTLTEPKVKYFRYGDHETQYLKQRDPLLGVYIDRIGPLWRPVNPDIFSALVNTIIGQQISSKAHQTVWARFSALLGQVTASKVVATEDAQIQSCGLTYRKVGYIKKAAQMVLSGELDLKGLKKLSDEEVKKSLIKIKGLGIWSAEMLLIFSLQRPDILSYDDLAITKGLKIVHKLANSEGKKIGKIDPQVFQKFCQLYSPYGSVASLYLWAISGGAGADPKSAT